MDLPLGATDKVMRISAEATSGVRCQSWMKIRQAIFQFGVTGYLRKILDDYLDNRILFMIRMKEYKDTQCRELYHKVLF